MYCSHCDDIFSQHTWDDTTLDIREKSFSIIQWMQNLMSLQASAFGNRL